MKTRDTDECSSIYWRALALNETTACPSLLETTGVVVASILNCRRRAPFPTIPCSSVSRRSTAGSNSRLSSSGVSAHARQQSVMPTSLWCEIGEARKVDGCLIVASTHLTWKQLYVARLRLANSRQGCLIGMRVNTSGLVQAFIHVSTGGSARAMLSERLLHMPPARFTSQSVFQVFSLSNIHIAMAGHGSGKEQSQLCTTSGPSKTECLWVEVTRCWNDHSSHWNGGRPKACRRLFRDCMTVEVLRHADGQPKSVNDRWGT